METRHLLLTALVLSCSAGVAGAADIRRGEDIRTLPTPAMFTCPAGYKLDGGPIKTRNGQWSYRCTAVPPKVDCGPGMEYFTDGACSFGCREKAVIR